MHPADPRPPSTSGLVIGLLGPVVGTRDGKALDLGPPLQQAVAAMLATWPGRVVTLPQLIAGLWGETAPNSSQQSVYTYIAGLRRAFEPGRGRRQPPRTVTKAPGGYLLRLDPLAIDAHLFSARLESASKARTAGDLSAALRALDEALALWRGPALSGVPGPFAEGERARLDELHLTAVEARAEVLTLLGRPEDALAPLRELARRHPLRERPHELLMLALHACGRQAEALRAFEEARRVLAEELGADPGDGLRHAHRLVLSASGDDPPAAPARREPASVRSRGEGGRSPSHRAPGEAGVQPPSHRAPGEDDVQPPSGRADRAGGGVEPAGRHVPRQLPRDPAAFVGRAREIVRLKSLLDPWGGEPPRPFVVICGPPGVGKSTLAVHVAHAVRDRFPDGRLYVNLRGGTPNVPRPSAYEVLCRLLRGLGTPGAAIPADEDEAAALLRSTLHGRRLLVLLDDAADHAQVRPFAALPPGTAVLVTSRESLAAGDGCAQVRLGPMSDAEATAMLAKYAGADRVSADLKQTGRLVRLCDGFPLALRIAGARLADRPDWSVAALTERLSDERRRLRELEAGDLAVRSSLAASWSALSGSTRETDAAAARLLALLGLLHVPDVTVEAAAALSGDPEPDVERALERLCDAHLLEAGEPGRYHPHDLVRLFAAELPPPGGRTAPLLRVLGFYAESARAAARTSDPHRVHCLYPPIDATGRTFCDAAEADDWLGREEATLLAAAYQAMADPDDGVARAGAAIGLALWWYQQKNYRVTDLVATGERLVATGERLRDEVIEMHGYAHMATGRYFLNDIACLAHNERHLALARRLGDRFEEQRAHGNLAATLLRWERFEESLDHALGQRAIAREIGSDVGERYALLAAARAYVELGRVEEAVGVLDEGAAMAERAGDVHSATEFAVWRGRVMIALGRCEAALGLLTGVLERGRILSRTTEMGCLVYLARAHRMLGQIDEAVRRGVEAVAMAERAGSTYWLEEAKAERALAIAARAAMTTR